MDELLSQLATHGGPVGILVYALMRMYNENQKKHADVQEARVADAKAVVQQVLDVSEKQNEITQELTAALQQNTVAMEGQREWIKELAKAVGREPPGKA